jgi:hypothetical protein
MRSCIGAGKHAAQRESDSGGRCVNVYRVQRDIFGSYRLDASGAVAMSPAVRGGLQTDVGLLGYLKAKTNSRSPIAYEQSATVIRPQEGVCLTDISAGCRHPA